MRNKISLFILLFFLFTLCGYSEEILPKFFGKDKEQSKKCILLSTNNISSDLAPIRDKILFPDGIAESIYIEQTLKKLNIDCIPVIPKSFFDRDTMSIKRLLGMPGPGGGGEDDGFVDTFKDYGIIIFAGHGGSGGAFAVENYHANNWEDKEDTIEIINEQIELLTNQIWYETVYGKDNIFVANLTYNDPIFDDKGKIIDEGERVYSQVMSISSTLLEKELPDLTGKLVVISSCMGAEDNRGLDFKNFKDVFLSKGASVVVASPTEMTTSDTERL